MRRIICYYLLFVFSTLAYSQAYKYKKKTKTLLKNRKEIAQVEGKFGMIKLADFKVKTMSGATILEVKEDYFTADYPTMSGISWYTFSFPQFDKQVIVKINSTYLNEKQFFKYEFEQHDVHFYPDGFRKEELDRLTDYTDELKKDTMRINEQIAFFQKNLKNGTVRRNNEGQVMFRDFRDSPEIAIIQGETENGEPFVIGKLRHDFNEGASISDPTRKNAITIYKKLTNPIDFNGTMTDYLVAGYINFLEIPKLFLFQNGKTAHFKIDPTLSEEEVGKQAAIFMTNNGFL